MSIRLIALDLDGTLLDRNKMLSEHNRRVLEECIARGIYVVPCTGRTAKGIPEAVTSIPGIRYAITVNGGMIEDLQTGEVLDQHLLDKDVALDVIDLVHDRHVMYDAYIQGEGISEERFYDHLEDYNIIPEIQKLIKTTRKKFPNIIEYVKKWDGAVDKVNLFFADMEERAEIRELLKKRTDLLVSSSVPNNLEINAPEAAKGYGLLRLAEILGIKQEETMAFGDGDNDLTMIRLAGVGVAMANGIEELKAIADHIAPDHNQSGVARTIEELVLSS